MVRQRRLCLGTRKAMDSLINRHVCMMHISQTYLTLLYVNVETNRITSLRSLRGSCWTNESSEIKFNTVLYHPVVHGLVIKRPHCVYASFGASNDRFLLVPLHLRHLHQC